MMLIHFVVLLQRLVLQTLASRGWSVVLSRELIFIVDSALLDMQVMGYAAMTSMRYRNILKIRNMTCLSN